MTLAEFLRWDDGTDTHCELIGGSPVAMAPVAAAHRMLAMRLGSRIDAALEPPAMQCASDPGVVDPARRSMPVNDGETAEMFEIFVLNPLLAARQLGKQRVRRQH
jgi:hypothetical protein